LIDVLSGGQGDIGAAMLPPPEGLWGMPPDRLKLLPGYDPDVQKNRTEARKIMQQLGYGPDNPLAVKVAARNIPLYRDPAHAPLRVDQRGHGNPAERRGTGRNELPQPGRRSAQDPVSWL
jgi:hypothetical protein